MVKQILENIFLIFHNYKTANEAINNIIANIKQHLCFFKYNIDIDFLVFIKKKYKSNKINPIGKIINTFLK